MSSLSIRLVNLADRKEYRVKADVLREQLKKLLVTSMDSCSSSSFASDRRGRTVHGSVYQNT
jgi:hypothetical protein